MQYRTNTVRTRTRSHWWRLLLVCAVLLSGHINAQIPETGTAQQGEAANVERLRYLLENYGAEIQGQARASSSEDLATDKVVQPEVEALNHTPLGSGNVRLSGSEASTALASIGQRLEDPRIPESRRDIAPICTIKTRLLNTLISVENRSLQPVGKNHYVARVRLQPGETTINILSDQWAVDLPEHANAQDFLITLYRPNEGATELHVFAIDDLLATGAPPIPGWLPDELDIKTHAG